MGRTHATEILSHNNLELIALVDQDIDNILQNTSTEKGNLDTGSVSMELLDEVNKYKSYKECLDKEKPDSVHVCVHTDMHYEIAYEALERGINVFVEKPLSLNLEQGHDLIYLAKKKNLTLMVGHVVRFMPPYRQLRNWIGNNEFGKLEFLYLNRVSGIPLWGQWMDKQKEFGSSGGALFDLLIHDIDFAIFAMGGTPDRIISNCLPGKLSNHDYVSADWKYKDRKIDIRIEGGNIFHSQLPFRAAFLARFEKASISYSSDNPEMLLVSDNTKTRSFNAGKPELGFKNEIDYFYECIENSTEPVECMPEDSLKTIETCYRHI